MMKVERRGRQQQLKFKDSRTKIEIGLSARRVLAHESARRVLSCPTLSSCLIFDSLQI
jgi:hypothetical protein